ncbi:MAG: alpha/beta fold hydrolase [Burkholderiaceae bacterium]
MPSKAAIDLPIVRAGAPTGTVLVVFHGVPGSPAELQWWDAAARRYGVQLWSLCRSDLPANFQGTTYFEALAAALPTSDPLHFAGFSIGGFVALRTAHMAQKAGRNIASLHLLSTAAPLEAGDFLTQMAGQSVFRMAQNHPTLLQRVAVMQGWLARVWPAALSRLFFASASSSDKTLAAEPNFQKIARMAFADSLNAGRVGYLRDLREYVQPWEKIVPDVQAPTWLWHGTEDNWSPTGMASWLQVNLPNCRRLDLAQGQSHYGCLLSRVEIVCALVAGSSALSLNSD